MIFFFWFIFGFFARISCMSCIYDNCIYSFLTIGMMLWMLYSHKPVKNVVNVQLELWWCVCICGKSLHENDIKLYSIIMHPFSCRCHCRSQFNTWLRYWFINIGILVVCAYRTHMWYVHTQGGMRKKKNPFVRRRAIGHMEKKGCTHKIIRLFFGTVTKCG